MASPIETLFILLKADVSDLKKKFEEAQKETKKLQEGLKGVSKTNKATAESFGATLSSLGRFIVASSAAAYVISGFRHSLDFGIQLNRTSKMLGINAEDLQAWGNAVELAGGDAKQFQSTLSSLAAKFGASPALALKALPLYADLLSKLSPARAQQVGKQLGLDEGTILLLQQGRREIEDVIKRQKELGVVTFQDAELYGKFKLSLVETSQASERFFNQLARIALPALIDFEKFSAKAFDYITGHKDLIKGGLIAISIGVTALTGSVIAANIPLALFAASLGLVALAYEDITHFAKDLPSLIGDTLGVKGITEYKSNLNKSENKFNSLPYSEQILRLIVPGYFSHPFSNNDNSSAQSIVINNPVINTQATDAEGIFDTLNKYASGHFNGQLSQATNHFTNMVAM
jgi:hypothetical protein